MSYLELQNPRNLVSGGVFGHFVAAVPSKGDGISLWMLIWEWKSTHYIVFLYVLVCILQHFGSENAADRKCFSIHILCSKAAFQQVSPVRRMGGKGKFKSSPKAKISHLDFRTNCSINGIKRIKNDQYQRRSQESSIPFKFGPIQCLI